MIKPGKVTVSNIRNFNSNLNTQYVKVDRSTELGNPFVLNKEEDRNLVCDQYEKYFYETLLDRKSTKEYLDSLVNILLSGRNIELLCWCSPKRCHALTVKVYLEKQLEIHNYVHSPRI